MVSTRKKRQSSKRLLSQLDDFDQDVIIGNTTSERRENVVVNGGVDDQDFTGGTSNVSSIVNENALNVKTLERCFNERIDREMSNIVDTVEDRIQNAVLTAIDNIVTPKIELAIRSINASSGRDVTSASGNSERREYEGINASFENASANNRTLGMANTNDETRHDFHDGVSELPVLEAQFDRQLPTQHMPSGASSEVHHSNSVFSRFSNFTRNVFLKNLVLTCSIITYCGHSKFINKTTGFRFHGFTFDCIRIGIITNAEIIRSFV